MPQPTAAQLDAILDRPGHEPCPGVASATAEIAPGITARIWRPDGTAASGAGLLAFHGGGFCAGDPGGCGAIAKILAIAGGCITVAPSYRLGSCERPTGHGILDDALTAWRWLQGHASTLAVDPGRIAVSGESAGCWPAGHLAVRSPLIGGLAGSPSPAALIAQWGPLDFVARWFDNGEQPGAEINIFGPGGYPAHAARYHQASVLTWAAGALPPALFVYGRRDRTVHPRQGQLGDAAWRAAGAHSELAIIDNIGHNVAGDNRERRAELLARLAGFCVRW